MNNFVVSEINELEKKMAGYQFLLNYRYKNLCVKADPMALLSVIVNINGEDKEIEDVADVSTPDDYHFEILPKMTNSLEEINTGILSYHPEFKPSTEQMEEDDPDTQYLVYEMPEVDKDRRDFLTEAAKSLHKECKARIDEIQIEATANFSELFSTNPESLKETKDAISDKHDEAIDAIDDLLEKKLQEIDDAYAHYLEERQEQESVEQEEDNFDFTKGMRQESDE